MNPALHVWVGTFGAYEIPERLRDVRMTARGWPDGRFKADCKRFMEWVRSVDVDVLKP